MHDIPFAVCLCPHRPGILFLVELLNTVIYRSHTVLHHLARAWVYDQAAFILPPVVACNTRTAEITHFHPESEIRKLRVYINSGTRPFSHLQVFQIIIPCQTLYKVVRMDNYRWITGRCCRLYIGTVPFDILCYLFYIQAHRVHIIHLLGAVCIRVGIYCQTEP